MSSAMVLRFHGSMRAGQEAGAETGPRFAKSSRRAGAFVPTRKPSRAELQEERAKSTTVAIASSLFLVLIAGALLVGGHVAIDPLLQWAIAEREAKGVGEVVYTMPDGVFCRHMSFDNVTAQLTERAIERCPSDISRGPNVSKFTWGSR